MDPAAINEATLCDALYTAGMPDPDLLIRTSGEMRVSNFLLWQIAYAELYVTETLWPDFSRAELLRAILDYQKRDRRFGGLPSSSLMDAPRAEGHAENTSEHGAESVSGHSVQPSPERNIDPDVDPDVESGTVETVGVPSR